MSWEEAKARAQGKRDGDIRTLKEVLESTKIFDSETAAFTDMLARLESNQQIQLTIEQRKWLDRTSDRIGAFVGEYENLVSSGKVKSDPNAPKFPFETMPRPLKPPGRK